MGRWGDKGTRGQGRGKIDDSRHTPPASPAFPAHSLTYHRERAERSPVSPASPGKLRSPQRVPTIGRGRSPFREIPESSSIFVPGFSTRWHPPIPICDISKGFTIKLKLPENRSRASYLQWDFEPPMAMCFKLTCSSNSIASSALNGWLTEYPWISSHLR